MEVWSKRKEEKMRRLYMFLLLLLIMVFAVNTLVFGAYSPEVSGDLEIGDRLYTDPSPEEERLDMYFYKKFWLKYKKKLSTSEYYYIKGQYYKKEYDSKIIYNNKALDLWGNYTTQLTEKLRRRWKFNIKDKDYYTSPIKSYYSLRVKYQLDYEYNEKSDYNVYIQRQWNNYVNKDSRDSTRDRLALDWQYDLSEDLEITTSYQFENQIYKYPSESSNKYGRKLSVGFKYEL